MSGGSRGPQSRILGSCWGEGGPESRPMGKWVARCLWVSSALALWPWELHVQSPSSFLLCSPIGMRGLGISELLWAVEGPGSLSLSLFSSRSRGRLLRLLVLIIEYVS